jgi:hypothetical protein
MKKISTKINSFKNLAAVCAITFGSSVFAQNAPIDFESTGKGAAWTWTSFENVGNAALQIVANPSATGANTSATCAKFTTLTGGQPWAGCHSAHGSDIGTFTLSASNAIVKIMVYKSVISDVGIKFATSADASSGEIKVANTKTNQWEELTFDFSSKITETNDQIIIFPDFTARTTDNVCYFDNITFSATTSAPKEPTVAAPTPTALAANVISLFSNAYTNKTVDTWRTGWSQATLTDIQVAGNDVKKYAGLDFAGVETVGANVINATSMEHFNIDIWTPNATAFKLKLVDFGPDGAFQGGDDKEHELSFTPTKEAWNTYKIALSDFTGLTTRAHMAQYIFVGVPAGTSIVYVDNVYFSKNASTSVNSIETANVSVYPNPANSNFSVTSANIIEEVTVLNALGQSVYTATPATNGVSVDASTFAAGVYTVIVKSNGQTTASKVAIN